MRSALLQPLLRAQLLVVCVAFFAAFPVMAQVSCLKVYSPATPHAAKPAAATVRPVVRPPRKSPTVNEMRAHLTGVHMTDYLPLDGVIRTSTTTESRATPLSTLHFALGEMVVSHDMGNWEAKKYAVLVPFKNLEPQLMTVLHQDTFILGDLKLQPGAILIAPLGEKISPIPGVKVIYFDSAQRKMRDVIREVLEQNDQWTFQSDGAFTDNKVMNNGRNMNNRDFFRHLLKMYPHLTYDLHSNDMIFKLEVDAGHDFEVLVSNKKSYGRSEFEQVWRIDAMELRELLEAMNARMATVTHPVLKAEYEKIRQRFQGRVNLMQAESALQVATGKSLLDSPGLPIEFKQEVLRLANNYEALLQYLKDNAALLRPKKEVDDENLSNQLKSRMYHVRGKLTLMQLSKFLRENSDIAELVDGVHFQEAMKQIEDFLRDQKNESKGLQAVEILKAELATCKRPQCWYYVHHLVERQFDSHLLQILALPAVRQNLSKFFDLSVFEQYTVGPYGDLRSWVWIAKSMKDYEKSPEERGKFFDYYGKQDLIPRPGAPPAPLQ